MSSPTEVISILLPASKRFLEEQGCPKSAKLVEKAAVKASDNEKTEKFDFALLKQLPYDAEVQQQLAMPQVLEILEACEEKVEEENEKKKKKKQKKLLAARTNNGLKLVLTWFEGLKEELNLDLSSVTKKLKKEASEQIALVEEAAAKNGSLSEQFKKFMAQKYGVAQKSSKKRAREGKDGEEPKKKKQKKVKKSGGTSLAASLDMTAELAWQPKKLEGVEESAEDKKKKKDRMDPILAREMNRRQDWDKWAEGLEGKDQRLQDGFHRVGDTWGDSAFADLSKVKGKSFVKEMQKKKRASWRGGGRIDMAVNSLMFSDSD